MHICTSQVHIWPFEVQICTKLTICTTSTQMASRALVTYTVEMATTQRTRPRTVVGAPLRAAWQLKSVLRHSVSAAPRTIIFLIFFTIIAGKLFFVSNNG